jgi:alpha-galactosidase
MKKNLLKYLLCFLIVPPVSAQEFAVWKDNRLVLDNGKVKREIVVENGRIQTSSLKLENNELNFNNKSDEFSFLIDGKSFNGGSGWSLISILPANDKYQGKGALVKLKGTKELNGIELEITYLLYPELPVIRKQITIINHSAKEIMLESFDVEKLKLGFSYVESVVYSNYGRQKRLSTYVGNWDDPILAIHSYELNSGLILGNEAPGVLKRIDYNTNYDNADIGLTHTDDVYPFRKYIRMGEQWTSPRTFVIPYNNISDPWQVMNTSLADFERKHMGLRIFEFKNRPVISSNSWNPFRRELSDSLIINVSKAAAECGIQLYTIDDGWFVNHGDWAVDKKKFPNGLKPVFDETKKMNIESGLWISVGTSTKSSLILKDHPEWAVKDEKGNPANLHSGIGNKITMCFGTEWKDYIKSKIVNLVKECDIKYVKLDLSILTSAYVTDYNASGCSAKNHPFHKDRKESFIVIYERLFELFDEIHEQFPGLYMDCTFETAGKLQLIDYAFCEHSEGNWLTNIEQPFPVGAFRIRNLAWWKSPVIPASSLIIGNLKVDGPDFIQELKTLVGSFPIVLGNPMKLSVAQRSEIKKWTDWLKSMQSKNNYDLYRQDLPGFGEPAEGNWDGWSRINNDTKEGGIIGIFKQGSLDDERTVSVPGLDQTKTYIVKNAPDDTEVTRMTGKDLFEKGFRVKMTSKYDSRLYEVQLVR